LHGGLLLSCIAIIIVSIRGIGHVLNFRRDPLLMAFLFCLILALLNLTVAGCLFWIQGSMAKNFTNSYTFMKYNKGSMTLGSDNGPPPPNDLHDPGKCAQFEGGNQHALCKVNVNNRAMLYVNINGTVGIVCSVFMIIGTMLGMWYFKAGMKKAADEIEAEEAAAEATEEVEEEEEEGEGEEAYVPYSEVTQVTGAMDLSLSYDGQAQVLEGSDRYEEWQEG